MAISDRIRKRRKACDLTLEDLSMRMGVSRQTLSRYETGIIKNIPSDKIENLAWNLETTPAYLMGWTDDYYNYDLDPDGRLDQIPSMWINAWQEEGISGEEMWRRYEAIEADIPTGDDILPLPTMRRLPLLGTIACGDPILAEENIEGFLLAPDDVDADFCLRCKGDSMINARIFDGDIVYIRQQPKVENGEIAAVLVEDEATLKRVRYFGDHISLEPENPQYRPLVFWGDEMQSVRVLGKAVAFMAPVN